MATDKLTSREVMEAFFDDGVFTETDALLKSSGGEAEVVTGFGTVDGAPVYAFAQKAEVMGGAMSRAQSKKIAKLYAAALRTGAPVVGFYDSAGGRLEERYDLLSAYGDIMNASAKLSGVVPRLSVVLGCCVGASALIAATADFVIVSEGAKLSVSASADSDDDIVRLEAKDAAEAVGKARDLLAYLPTNNLEAAPAYESLPPYSHPDKLPKYIADEDSLFCVGGGCSDEACVAFGRVDGRTVGFIVTKGKDISREGARLMLRHIRFCDAFSLPVITVADAGDFMSLSDAAALAAAYADATTAKITVISGRAVGSVYIALAGSGSGADAVYALPEAVVSPIAPKAAAYLMEPSIADLPYAEQDGAIAGYVAENLSAASAAADGYVDDILTREELRGRIVSALDMLSSKRVATLPKKHTTI